MIYSPGQVFLHWLSALIIVWALASGFAVAWLDVAQVTRDNIGAFNVSISLLFIPLFCIRTYLSLRGCREHYRALGSSQALMVFLIHKIIYLVIAVVLLSGVLMMKQPASVFGLLSMPAPLGDPAWLGFFDQVHGVACALLGALVGLHVAAVIRHEWRGQRVLARMRW